MQLMKIWKQGFHAYHFQVSGFEGRVIWCAQINVTRAALAQWRKHTAMVATAKAATHQTFQPSSATAAEAGNSLLVKGTAEPSARTPHTTSPSEVQPNAADATAKMGADEGVSLPGVMPLRIRRSAQLDDVEEPSAKRKCLAVRSQTLPTSEQHLTTAEPNYAHTQPAVPEEAPAQLPSAELEIGCKLGSASLPASAVATYGQRTADAKRTALLARVEDVNLLGGGDDESLVADTVGCVVVDSNGEALYITSGLCARISVVLHTEEHLHLPHRSNCHMPPNPIAYTCKGCCAMCYGNKKIPAA